MTDPFSKSSEDLTYADAEKLIEDLRQHQFELQQQNEELRRTHAELDRATIRYRDLWENAPIGYVSHERSGMITSANERARMLLEPIATITGNSTLQNYFDPHSVQVLRQHLWSVTDSATPVSAELKLRTNPNQSERWVRIESSITVKGEYRSALIDITAQKVAEADRVSLATQLRQSQKMEVLHELSAGMAHDFNNLLQVIIAYGEFVRSQLAKSELPTEHVENLLQGAERAAGLTSRLLAFSRRSSLMAHPVDIRELVHNTANIARRTLGERITLQESLGDQPLTACVDENLFDQAFLNLLVNARDAMPRGGLLTTSAELRSLDEVKLINGCRLDAGDYVVVKVQDDGVGMTEDVAERIFEPFFTTKAQGTGTGLGLSIVFGIVRQHNGAIDVHSQPEHGTCFEIYLPLAEPEEKDNENVHNADLSAPKGTRILFAEDQESIRDVLTRTLTDEGFEVLAAESAHEAMQLLKEQLQPVDLLLTDVEMPHGDGKELCEFFHEWHPDAPVIFLTGHGDGVIDKNFVEDHDATILPKPVRKERLLSVIAERMQQSGAAES
jgi:signal transduction histidine kinase/ActR/RegA family two-component response regulator